MKETGEHSYVQFGPFSIGYESECLMRGSEPIKLRPMSLQFLRYLAKRPGQFVSKEELLERVWSGRVISDSGLRLCAREIRAALDDDAKNPRYLETVVGKGYRFLEGAGGKAPSMENAAPFVGRDDDLLYLDEMFQSSVAGSTQFALLAGEPGIGKTTLLKVFLDHISNDHDANIIQGQCVVHFGKQEAYGPMLEAITAHFHNCNDAGLVKLMERHAPAWLLQLPEMLDSMLFERIKRRTEGMAPERMLREFCQLIAALTEKKSLVLVIEDLHWADVATIDLLAALAEYKNLRLMILATYRPADAVLYSQSLRDTVRELKGRESCRELLLELLTESDLATYLAGRLNGEISPDLVAELYPRTGGNPLFMVTLIEALIQAQSLVCRDGIWSISDPAALTDSEVPESLQSLITRFLEALPLSRRNILEAASVTGAEFSAAALTDVLELSIEEVESECESLCADDQFIEPGKLVTWPDGTLSGSYRFQHHLYLEVIYGQIAEARRSRIHRGVGYRLEAGYGERADEIAVTLASHFDIGNDPDKAQHFHLLAAERALSRHAYLPAVEQLQMALDGLHRLAESGERSRQELDLLMQLGPVLIATGGYTSPDVAPTYQRAIELCEQLESPAEHFAALWNIAGYHMARGALAQSRPLIERAVEVVDGIEDESLDLMKADAFMQQLFFEGDFSAAHDQAEIVISRYRPGRHLKLAETYSQEDPGIACTSVDAVLAWMLGYSELSLERIDRVHRLVARLENPHSTSFGLAFSAMASQLRRDLKATIEDAEGLINVCLERDVHWTPYGGILKGWALAQSDPRPEHLDSVRQGVEDWVATGNMLVVPYLCSLQAETQAKLGEIDGALSTLEYAMSQAEENQERWFDAEFYRLKGDFLLQHDGKPVQEAEHCYHRSLEIARAQNAHALELRTAHGLALLRIEQGRTEEVPPLLQPILTRFDADADNRELEQARRLVG